MSDHAEHIDHAEHAEHAGPGARRAAAFRIGATMAGLLAGSLALVAVVRPDVVMAMVRAAMRAMN